MKREEIKRFCNKDFRILNCPKKCFNAQRKGGMILWNNEDWLEGTFEMPVSMQMWSSRIQNHLVILVRSETRKTEETRSSLFDEWIVPAAQKNTPDFKNIKRSHKILCSRRDRKSNQGEITSLRLLPSNLTKRQYEIVRDANKSLLWIIITYRHYYIIFYCKFGLCSVAIFFSLADNLRDVWERPRMAILSRLST